MQTVWDSNNAEGICLTYGMWKQITPDSVRTLIAVWQLAQHLACFRRNANTPGLLWCYNIELLFTLESTCTYTPTTGALTKHKHTYVPNHYTDIQHKQLNSQRKQNTFNACNPTANAKLLNYNLLLIIMKSLIHNYYHEIRHTSITRHHENT